jgi:hypothetical protein
LRLRRAQFTNNCHNFSDDVTQFLVGKAPAEGGFPQWCLDHGGAALSNLPNADAETIRCVVRTIEVMSCVASPALGLLGGLRCVCAWVMG